MIQKKVISFQKTFPQILLWNYSFFSFLNPDSSLFSFSSKKSTEILTVTKKSFFPFI